MTWLFVCYIIIISDDEYIVERAGKPLVAIIPITKYQQIQDEKMGFFEWIGKVRERTKNMSVREIEKTIEDAVHAVSGEADFIISGDHHLLNLKTYQGIKIISPAEFLKERFTI